MKEILQGKENEFIGVKIGVKRRMFHNNNIYNNLKLFYNLFSTIHLGGCNGYSYTMNYASTEDMTNGKFEVVKIKTESNLYVLVDKKAVFFLVGTSMHWEVSILKIYSYT